MALRDVSVLFRTPWIIISRTLAFLIQLFVFAFLISPLITSFPPPYKFFPYYTVGMLAATVASISFIIGYDIFEEAEEGLLDYLLSLPISRRQFIVARAFGGAVRAMIYIIPMFIIIAVMLGFGDLFSIGMAVLSLFLLAFGVTGLSITMAVTVRSANRFDVTLALLDLALTRASTALYPIQKLPSYAVPLANISPVSFASGITRSLLLPGPGFDLYSLASLVAFVLVFLGLGAAFYFRRLEGGVYA